MAEAIDGLYARDDRGGLNGTDGPRPDTRAAEEEVGRLILRLHEVTSSMFEDAKNRAEELVARAQAQAADILETARRDAEHIRSSVVSQDLRHNLQAAHEAMGELRQTIDRRNSPWHTTEDPVGSPAEGSSLS